MKTYHGSCECEKVTYEVSFDLSAGTFKCNCRMCTKTRFWAAAVNPDQLKILTGKEELSTYWDNPMHHFCSHCGTKVFGLGKSPSGKPMMALVLATLDDLDPRELAQAPVSYFDGKHDRFDRAPEFSGHL
ncbi:GFA family protein [bacterium]|jgi:hypothetical protein|nr:GFA family protein [bacterium]